MKRKLILLFAVIVLIFTFSFGALAAGSLSANNISAKTGDTFTVEVKLNNNPGIIATRIFVDYDTKYLSLEKVENGVVFPASKALFGKDYSEMPYKMLWEDALSPDITANGNLATLTFKVKAQDPSGKTLIRITVDKSSTFDEELKEKSIGDAVCTVSFPSVTAEKNEATTQQTTKKTDPETAKTTSESTRQPSETTTKKADKPTTKPVPPVTSPTTPSATKVQEETLGTMAPVTEKTTSMDATGAKTTTASQGTSEVSVTQPSSNDGETAVDTEKAAEAVADLNESQSETQTAPIQSEPSEKKNLGYLWLLTVIPVAAVIIILIKKKAGADNAQ